MATWTEDEFMRQGVLIAFLWLVAMLVGGLGLLRFSDVLQGLFA